MRLRVLVARIQLDNPLPAGDGLVEVPGGLGGQGRLVLGRGRCNGVFGGHSNTRGDAHLRSGLENLRDDGEHLFLRCRTLEERNGAPANESDDRRHALDLERLGDRGCLVDINLDQLELARLLARDLLEHGQSGLGLERARRPHDHDDRHGLGRGHDVLEVLLVRGGDERDVQALPRCGSGRLRGSGCA